MKRNSTNSLIKVLKVTNNYLLVSFLFIFFALSTAFAIMLFQSHQVICELFNSKIDSSGSGIARELALGENEVAIELFNKLKTSLLKATPEVKIKLITGFSKIENASCVPGVFNSVISHKLFFSSEQVGLVEGEIKSLKTEKVISFSISIIVFLIVVLNFIRKKLLENIKTQIVLPIERLCNQEILVQSDLPLEVRTISEKLLKLKESIISSEFAKQELAQAKKISQVANQVAHDIRSPLEMLKALKDDIRMLPEESGRRIQMGINRIEDIAINLLKKHKVEIEKDFHLRSEDLLIIIKSILYEKAIEFRKFENIQFDEFFDSNSYGLFSVVDRVCLNSIISNLINNSVESLNFQRGTIKIGLISFNEFNLLNISDNGPGIPEDVAKKLFTRGFTTKKDGNGLGLYSAKQDIEAIGGTLTFSTEVGVGTTFTISLPRSQAPENFVDAIHIEKYDKIIVLDDDSAFHEVWSKRFDNIDIEVEHIYSVNEILTKYQTLDTKILFLSDFDLMDKGYDGIDVIVKLANTANSVLVTARSEEHIIQERCLKYGIKLLPKSMVNYVKVINKIKNHHPIILIDDDKLIRLNWSMHCQKKGFTFHSFKSIVEFIEVAHLFEKECRIFIDSNLENEIKGEIESEKISNLGFKNLYLATGYEKEFIQKPDWIIEVYSKSPEIL